LEWSDRMSWYSVILACHLLILSLPFPHDILFVGLGREETRENWLWRHLWHILQGQQDSIKVCLSTQFSTLWRHRRCCDRGYQCTGRQGVEDAEELS
jgi:hypothetical protein